MKINYTAGVLVLVTLLLGGCTKDALTAKLQKLDTGVTSADTLVTDEQVKVQSGCKLSADDVKQAGADLAESGQLPVVGGAVQAAGASLTEASTTIRAGCAVEDAGATVLETGLALAKVFVDDVAAAVAAPVALVLPAAAPPAAPAPVPASK